MNPSIPGIVVKVVVVAVALAVMLKQCRKPAWWPGRIFLRIMNNSHSGVTDWGLTHVTIGRRFTVLDVGCGGGRTIGKLAGLAGDGKVFGIDYSAASVATSRSTNEELIEAGRVDIRQGTVSHLPYEDGTFDVVTAVETHYYWPDPPADFRQILRVLKPGGRVVVIAETYKGRRFDTLYQPAMKLLHATYLTLDEHKALLGSAGYSDINIFEERGNGWICAVGKKPAAPAG